MTSLFLRTHHVLLLGLVIFLLLSLSRFQSQNHPESVSRMTMIDWNHLVIGDSFDRQVGGVINAVSMTNPSSPSLGPVAPSKQSPHKINHDSSFSACLLIMDDNHHLTEWISYHYFTLKLRYLVVTVDPHSKTSPSKLLDRWRDRMTIVEWTDSNFTKGSKSLRRNTESDTRDALINKHRTRQTQFYQACAFHLQQQNRTWTLFTDIDEYMAINSQHDVVINNNSSVLMHQPGSILRLVQQYSNNETRLQNVKEPELSWYKYFQQGPCLTIPRTLFGAVESTPAEVAHDTPAFVDAKQFQTLRWRYRATPREKSFGLAKSIIDVSRIVSTPKHQLVNGGGSAHRPFIAICPDAWVNINSLPLLIRHYLGSWESYSFREDARKGANRNYEVWQERSKLQDGGVDDDVRLWLSGFVNMVGNKTAQQLLKDAGLPPNYKKSANETALWASMNPLP